MIYCTSRGKGNIPQQDYIFGIKTNFMKKTNLLRKTFYFVNIALKTSPKLDTLLKIFGVRTFLSPNPLDPENVIPPTP